MRGLIAGAIALALLLQPAAARRVRASTPDGAWQVAPGSHGNELDLALYNLDNATMPWLPTVTVAAAPSWMGAVSVTATPATPGGASDLAPGDMVPVTITFDVSPLAAPGAQGVVNLAITTPDGDAWHEPVAFEVAANPDEVQSDCCSAIEISTTGIPGAGSPGTAGGPGAGGISVTNYPNPSNPGTTIRFSIPARSDVLVTIHDVSGRLVRTLARGARDAGVAELAWDGSDDRGLAAPSGIYFVRVTSAGTTRSAKLILAR